MITCPAETADKLEKCNTNIAHASLARLLRQRKAGSKPGSADRSLFFLSFGLPPAAAGAAPETSAVQTAHDPQARFFCKLALEAPITDPLALS